MKGYWPTASNGKIAASTDQVVGYPSHPYAMKMNSDYFVALARTFEDKYGVEFQGIRDGAVTDAKERLVQFKTNMDVAMSLLDRNGPAKTTRPSSSATIAASTTPCADSAMPPCASGTNSAIQPAVAR